MVHQSKVDTDAFDDDEKKDGDEEEICGEVMRHNEEHRGEYQRDNIFFLIHGFHEEITRQYHEEMSQGQGCGMTGLIHVEGDDCKEQ